MLEEVARICDEKNFPNDIKENCISKIKHILGRSMTTRALLGCGNAYIDFIKNKSAVLLQPISTSPKTLPTHKIHP
jgi:hypothetical protein